MDKSQTLFIELLQMALGSRDKFSRTPNEEEWSAIYDTAQKQTVTALLLPAVDRLSTIGQGPSKKIILSWIGLSEQISAQNRLVNQRCVEITKLFADSGFRSCILKGQGNALLYDNPLSRAPGDVDVWIDSDRTTIKSFVTEHCPDAEDSNLHIEYPVFKDVSVEVHYRPTIARSYKYNNRLQLYYDNWADECFRNQVALGEGTVSVPVPELNVAMQMSHVMNHFFEEGIGLRQVIDLYYLLKKTGFDRPKMGNKLRFLGMGRFTGAMMWILHHELGLEEKYLIAEPDKRRGKLVLKEILTGGNFGRYDQRDERKLYSKSPLIYKIVRNMKYLWLFPTESFVSPAVAKIRQKRFI